MVDAKPLAHVIDLDSRRNGIDRAELDHRRRMDCLAEVQLRATKRVEIIEALLCALKDDANIDARDFAMKQAL